MPIQRAVHLIRSSQRASSVFFISRRLASSESSHHHDDHPDSVVYPKEGFHGPFWRNVAIITLLATGIAYYAPADFFPNPSVPIDDAPWLTRVIAYYIPSEEVSRKKIEDNLILSEQLANRNLLFRSAQIPLVRRFRYTSFFEQSSSHSIPVGGVVDLSDLVIKGDDE